MEALRRRSTRWIRRAALPFVLLCQIPWLCIFCLSGWPGVPMTELEPEVFLWSTAGTIAVSNIPDFTSIVVYVRMLRHFRRQKKSKAAVLKQPVAAPEVEAAAAAAADEAYGGIWVGGDAVSLDVKINNFVGDQDLPNLPQSLQQHYSPPMPPVLSAAAGGDVGAAGGAGGAGGAVDSDHGEKAVMKAIKCHVSLCLVDAVLTFTTIFVCSPHGKIVFHLVVLVNGIWVPFIVIKNSFKQLDSLFGIGRVICQPWSQ